MNIYIHKYIYSVEGHYPLTDSFVIYKGIVCIKFLQIIVIFPESPQTGVEAKTRGGGTLKVEVIGTLVGNIFGKP